MEPWPSHSTPVLHMRRAVCSRKPAQKRNSKTTHHPQKKSHRTTHHHEYGTPTETMSITIQPTSVWDIRPGDPIRHMHSTWIVTQTHHHGAGFTIDLQRTDRKRMPRLLRTHWTEDLTLDLVEKKNS